MFTRRPRKTFGGDQLTAGAGGYTQAVAANRRAVRQSLHGQAAHEESCDQQPHAGTRSDFSDQVQCGRTFSFYEGCGYEGSDFVGPDHEGAD